MDRTLTPDYYNNADLRLFSKEAKGNQERAKRTSQLFINYIATNLKFQLLSIVQGWHSCEKSLNFCASPWKVREFFSTLNIVAWKVFLNTFCKSQLREGNGDLHKFFFFMQ